MAISMIMKSFVASSFAISNVRALSLRLESDDAQWGTEDMNYIASYMYSNKEGLPGAEHSNKTETKLKITSLGDLPLEYIQATDSYELLNPNTNAVYEVRFDGDSDVKMKLVEEGDFVVQPSETDFNWRYVAPPEAPKEVDVCRDYVAPVLLFLGLCAVVGCIIKCYCLADPHNKTHYENDH